MEIFINGTSCISHYQTFLDDYFFEDAKTIQENNFLFISDPNYKDYIPAAAIRRTSHILKMGISAGLMCAKKREGLPFDAIITGTAMGCFEDTDKFLRSIDENDEKMLTPTSFIQSTHNTVAGQLALLLKCHQYNFTYVHQELSFEFVLLDALMLLQEKEAQNVLVGGVDELIPSLCELFERAGHIKKTENLGESLRNSTSKGYVAGEGAAFFQLSSSKQPGTQVALKGVKTSTLIDSSKALSEFTSDFLKETGFGINDISLVFSGINGDMELDKVLNEYTNEIQKPLASFKNLCGEYFTASAFAMWMAVRSIEKQKIPVAALYRGEVPSELKNILIINHSSANTYSLLCISKC
ncbi:MAG: beta-ketoacyl synthase chain length factor [Bacteroidia bacterium]|nr:beta-ketoacyl synthase chain length factor [Bacteroidia bacterium]